MLSRISEWINDAILAVFNGVLNDLAAFATTNMAELYEMALTLLELDYVRNTIIMVQVFAGSVLVVRIAYHSLVTYILHQNGDSNQDPKKLLFESSMGVILISISPWLVTWTYKLGTTLAIDLAQVISFEVVQINWLGFLIKPGLTLAIVVILAIVLWLLIFIQAAIRSVEVALLAVMGPVMAIGGLSDMFSSWWKNLVVLSLTQAVQIFLIKGALITAGLTFFGQFSQLLFTIAFLWVAYKTPNILKEYAYSSGTGQAIGGVAQQAGSHILMRKMLTKV